METNKYTSPLSRYEVAGKYFYERKIKITDLTPVINAVIALAAALITAFVIPWIKRNTSAKDREEFLKWVEIAVSAAEQLFYSTQGTEKKKYVVQFLEGKGFTFSETEIDAAIEGAVLKLHRNLEAAA